MQDLIVNPKQITSPKVVADVARWVTRLDSLTKQNDANVNENWIKDFGEALINNLPYWVFNNQSCFYVAKKHTFFPSLKELIEDLTEWSEIYLRKKNEFSSGQQQLLQNSANLPQPIRNWIASYFNHRQSHWIMNDKEIPPILIQEAREKCWKELVRKNCFEAYKYLFPEEVKKQAEDKDYNQSWQGLTIDHVYQKIQEIEKNGSRVLKKATARLLRRAVVNYAPDSLQLVDQQYPNLNKNTEEVA